MDEPVIERPGGRPNHRRSLLAVSSLAIVYQLGWLRTNSIAGMQLADDKVQWVLGALLIYFFVVYHQASSFADVFKWRLSHAVQERLARTLFAKAQVEARRVAHPHEKEIDFVGPTRPPQWPIAPPDWKFTFRLGRQLNDPNARQVVIRVGNPWGLRSLMAWAYVLAMTPFAVENFFPSLWALIALVMFIPIVRVWVRAVLG